MIMRYVCAQQAGTGLIFEFRSLFSLYYFPLLIHSTVFQVDFTHVWALANGPDCGDLEEKAGDCWMGWLWFDQKRVCAHKPATKALLQLCPILSSRWIDQYREQEMRVTDLVSWHWIWGSAGIQDGALDEYNKCQGGQVIIFQKRILWLRRHGGSMIHPQTRTIPLSMFYLYS